MNDMLSQIDGLQLARLAAPLLALLAGALLSIAAAAIARGRAWKLEFGAAAAGLVIAACAAWQLWPAAPAGSVFGITVDRLALTGILIIVVAAGVALLISPAHQRARGDARPGYAALVALAAFGMAALVSAADLVTLVVALEIAGLSTAALAGFARERPAAVEGALKYFITGAFATAFLCMGIAFLFGSAGTTDLAVLAARAADAATSDARNLFLFGIAMLVAGLAFKVTAVPFHAWAPDTYDGAPTPVTLLLATGAKAAGFVALWRVAVAVAPAAGMLWHDLLWALAALTILWGNLAALRQDSLKRLLAYACIAQSGYLLMAFPSIAVAPAMMARALLLYLVADVIMTAGAFAAVAAVGLAPGEPCDVGHLRGLSRERPWLAAVLTLFLLSIAGFPPTVGFFGKYYLFFAAVRAGDAALAVVAVAGTVVSAAYVLRPIVAMYFRDARPATLSAAARPLLSVAMKVALAVAAIAVLLFGLLPQDLVAFVESSVR